MPVNECDAFFRAGLDAIIHISHNVAVDDFAVVCCPWSLH